MPTVHIIDEKQRKIHNNSSKFWNFPRPKIYRDTALSSYFSLCFENLIVFSIIIRHLFLNLFKSYRDLLVYRLDQNYTP